MLIGFKINISKIRSKELINWFLTRKKICLRHIFLMSLKGSGLVDTIKDIAPLPLDPALDTDHLQNLLRVRAFGSDSIRDEIESEYEELEDVKERLEIIDLIRNPGVSFGEVDDTDGKQLLGVRFVTSGYK